MIKIGHARPLYIKKPFGRSYGLWEWKGEHFPRTRFPAGSVTRDGFGIDLQTGEVFEQAGLGALPDVPLPPNIPRPEMWTPEDVVRAVNAGYRFLLPFVWGESFFEPNAYYIAGEQASASGLTVGPEHTPDLRVGEDGWLRAKVFFRAEMVPERAWLAPPNERGIVPVIAEMDPETIDWELLNRGHQIEGRFL